MRSGTPVEKSVRREALPGAISWAMESPSRVTTESSSGERNFRTPIEALPATGWTMKGRGSVSSACSIEQVRGAGRPFSVSQRAVKSLLAPISMTCLLETRTRVSIAAKRSRCSASTTKYGSFVRGDEPSPLALAEGEHEVDEFWAGSAPPHDGGTVAEDAVVRGGGGL